jgi:hypothetical protein
MSIGQVIITVPYNFDVGKRLFKSLRVLATVRYTPLVVKSKGVPVGRSLPHKKEPC